MTSKQLTALSKIKNPEFRRLIGKMVLTWEIIQHMEEYHKQYYR